MTVNINKIMMMAMENWWWKSVNAGSVLQQYSQERLLAKQLST